MENVEESTNEMEEEVGKVMEQARELQEAGAGLISMISNDEQSLRLKANSLDSSIRHLLEEDLQTAICIITDGDAAGFLPANAQGWYLRMFLGPISVRASRKEIQLKAKEEYNSYRDRTALMFILFPLILLILRSWIWEGCLPAFPVQLYEAWLLFLNTGLALRENILRANGSDIRPWWIYHHYFAMATALVSLTWEIKGQPNCGQKQSNSMNVARRETTGVDCQLWVLCPILFVMQGFEAYVGLLLLKTAFARVVTEWQIIFCGIILVILAVGNFINTAQTLMAKSRFKGTMKKSKSRRELY
ncbi:hypothetical protein GOBAR_AA12292 [Gossypium barbadense]|uniref:TMPIT-like protein n=1 Tax=Gossypium barbadense TaxID=3634 RepID=A0A2P5XYD3_GOSBA|nr:hypothetical protein GOBAR_AA12292 [Gossypium barbadense]